MSRREYGYEQRPEHLQRPLTRADRIALRIFYVGMIGVIVLFDLGALLSSTTAPP